MVLTVHGNVVNALTKLALPDGSAALPSYAFGNNITTGMFHYGNGSLGFSSNGIAIMTVTSNGIVVNGTLSATYLDNYTYPTISNVRITDASYAVIDDVAVANQGFIEVNGNNYTAGTVVYTGTAPALSTTYVSATKVRAQVGSLVSGTYGVTVFRPDGVLATKPLGITFSPFPVWSTGSDLGGVVSNTAFTFQVAATSDSNVVYANTTTMPTNTVVASNGVVVGNLFAGSDTVFTFGVGATDQELQNVSQTFQFTCLGPFVARRLLAGDAAAYDYFGRSLTGDANLTRAVIGAYGKSGSYTGQGAAYVFLNSGGTWTQEQKVTISDPAFQDYLGQCNPGMDSTGTRFVVGANGKSSNSGAAYIFTRSGTTWTQEAKLTASDAATNDNFGQYMSMDSSGTRVVVGAPGKTTNTGAAYIFVRSGTTWTQEAKITASDGATSDYFGTSVAIDSTGTRVVVGAYAKNSYTGAAYVFIRSGTTWTQEAKITASDTATSDDFGLPITIDSTGTRFVVGAHGKNSSTGAAYIFTRSGTTWTQEAKITASDAAPNDYFGLSLSMDSAGSKVMVGAYGKYINYGTNGAVYVFSRSGTTWTQMGAKIYTSDASSSSTGDYFGIGIYLRADGLRGIAGKMGYDGSYTDQGAAYTVGYSGGANWITY